jgi:hypothetical protein
VEREPIAFDRGDAATAEDWWEPRRCEEIPGYYATVRHDARAVLGIVGERYRIISSRALSEVGGDFGRGCWVFGSATSDNRG